MKTFSKETAFIVGAVVLVGIGYFLFAARGTYAPPPGITGPLMVTEMKYLILDRFPNIFWCDSDFYPIARDDEQTLAIERFPTLQENTEEFGVITKHLNLEGKTPFTDAEKLLIYREHKRLHSFTFAGVGNVYNFEFSLEEDNKIGYGTGTKIEGAITTDGRIRITRKEEGFITTCPICLAEGTSIDTPNGAVPVEATSVGMIVWTLDDSGKKIATPIIRIAKTAVPKNHEVVHVVLTDGRSFSASAPHPLADGRAVGDLREGDALAGSRVLTVERVPYQVPATYDILPAGGTGIYFTNGIPLMSTLYERS